MEPLYLGVIPQVSVPLVGAIIGVLGAIWAGGLGGKVIDFLEKAGRPSGEDEKKVP